MTETLANWFSFESTQQELSNEYQHGKVYMVFKNLCILVLWTKVASALKRLKCTKAISGSKVVYGWQKLWPCICVFLKMLQDLT